MFDGSFQTNRREINLGRRSTSCSTNRTSLLHEARQRRLTRAAATTAARLDAVCVLQRCWRGVRWRFAQRRLARAAATAAARSDTACVLQRCWWGVRWCFARGAAKAKTNVVDEHNQDVVRMDGSKLKVCDKAKELQASKPIANIVTPEKKKVIKGDKQFPDDGGQGTCVASTVMQAMRGS
jgi:hypothetical protein